MSHTSGIQPVNTTYEPFSNEPIYIEANRGFILRQKLGEVRRFLDLACGTGTVSALLLAESPSAHLCGIDLDPVQIDLAAERFRGLGYEVRRGRELTAERSRGKPVVTLAVGGADDLTFPPASFDCVTIANAIHLLPDKAKFLTAVARVLRPGGLFGFNSAFYAGTMPKGTDRIYLDWIRLASERIQEQSRRLEAEGKPPIRRVRGTARGAFQNRWLKPDEWRSLLSEFGLNTLDVNERLVELDARSFALVGAYGGMAEVLLSGYPVESASEALQAAAKPAMDLSGAATVPRVYLEMWAVKS